MANVKHKIGNGLPSAIEEGSIIIDKQNEAMYVDTDDANRITIASKDKYVPWQDSALTHGVGVYLPGATSMTVVPESYEMFDINAMTVQGGASIDKINSQNRSFVLKKTSDTTSENIYAQFRCTLEPGEYHFFSVVETAFSDSDKVAMVKIYRNDYLEEVYSWNYIHSDADVQLVFEVKEKATYSFCYYLNYHSVKDDALNVFAVKLFRKNLGYRECGVFPEGDYTSSPDTQTWQAHGKNFLNGVSKEFSVKWNNSSNYVSLFTLSTDMGLKAFYEQTATLSFVPSVNISQKTTLENYFKLAIIWYEDTSGQEWWAPDDEYFIEQTSSSLTFVIPNKPLAKLEIRLSLLDINKRPTEDQTFDIYQMQLELGTKRTLYETFRGGASYSGTRTIPYNVAYPTIIEDGLGLVVQGIEQNYNVSIPGNLEAQSMQVKNSPVSDYDVVNRGYLEKYHDYGEYLPLFNNSFLIGFDMDGTDISPYDVTNKIVQVQTNGGKPILSYKVVVDRKGDWEDITTDAFSCDGEAHFPSDEAPNYSYFVFTGVNSTEDQKSIWWQGYYPYATGGQLYWYPIENGSSDRLSAIENIGIGDKIVFTGNYIYRLRRGITENGFKVERAPVSRMPFLYQIDTLETSTNNYTSYWDDSTSSLVLSFN